MISLHADSLVKLLNQVSTRLNVPLEMAEVGVAAGDTSVRLFAEFPNLTMWLVDPYEDYQRTRASEMRPLLVTLVVNTQPYRDRRKLLIIPSPAAAELVPDNSLDLVFLDGNHTYDGVKADLLGWWPKLKSTGSIMCGDDYRPKHAGVIKAVDEWAEENHHQLEFLPTNVWWTAKA